MHTVIRFTTAMFDVTREHSNEINPIYGESLLLWLAEQAKGAVAIPAPSTEDWGWYVYIDWKGRGYMLGASGAMEDSGRTTWVLQVVKQRSLIERLLGKQKMALNDPCAKFFREILERNPAIGALAVEEP